MRLRYVNQSASQSPTNPPPLTDKPTHSLHSTDQSINHLTNLILFRMIVVAIDPVLVEHPILAIS